MPDTVLIITQELDPHADRLVVILGDRGVERLRWHPDSLADSSTIAIRSTAAGVGGRISVHGRVVDLGDIRSVWHRRPAAYRFPASVTGDERVFAEQEIAAAVSGMLRVGEWFWVNHPDRNRNASSKPLQLKVAHGLGFEIPQTLVLTPDGRYVFLEINPAGQFGWIEDMTGAPMTAALADMLMAGRPP